MADRLTKIVTRTGDDGTTGLGDGSRVRKSALRVALLGELDELSSSLGMALAEPMPEGMRALLSSIQNDLFDVGGELSVPGRSALWDAHVERLDRAIESLREPLPTLRDFVLPGGTRAAAATHFARAVCRRAERALVALGAEETVSELSLQYMNRLSDVLFLAARTLNAVEGHAETIWHPGGEVEAP